MTRKQFGDEIRRARKVKNLSQTTLAKRAGTSTQRISETELGKSNLTLDKLLCVCAALKVSINLVSIKLENYDDL